jgi:hypothetical protein
MKKTISSFLLIIILLPSLAKVIYITYWNLDREALTKEYCKNQDKPELECNGQCHLEETLGKIDDSADGNPDKNALAWEKLAEMLVFTNEIISDYSFNNKLLDLQLLNKKQFYYLDTYRHARLNLIFHPPCFG